MRRSLCWSLVPVLLLAACSRPEVEAFRLRPAPIAVRVALSERVNDRDGLASEYAAVLRSRLAYRAEVVPEGLKPPPGAAELLVEIREVSPRAGSANPAAVGLAVGASVGILSAASGNRGMGVVDGLFWGLFAGSHAAMHRDRVMGRLGYLPQAVSAQVRLVQPGHPEPLWVDSIDPMEVVEAMDPLPRSLRDDDGRIREEEAKAFARVVVQKASAFFRWTRGTEPRFYGNADSPREALPPLREGPPSTPPPQMTPPPPPAVLPPPPAPPSDPKAN